MSNLKTYRVTYPNFDDAEVWLQVDHSVLTATLASEINTFWSAHEHRLAEQGGDVVATVIRLFGTVAIGHFMADGGIDFAGHVPDDSVALTQEVIASQHEGWPSCEALGILIVRAVVDYPSFWDVSLEAV